MRDFLANLNSRSELFGDGPAFHWDTFGKKKKVKPSGGGRTESEASFGESMAAAGYQVSPTNLPDGVSSGSTPYSPPGTSGGSTAAPAPKSASEKLDDYRAKAEKLVDKDVKFDEDTGLPKLKSAAASVVKASAKVGAKAEGRGRSSVKKPEKPDPALQMNSATGLTKKKQREAKKLATKPGKAALPVIAELTAAASLKSLGEKGLDTAKKYASGDIEGAVFSQQLGGENAASLKEAADVASLIPAAAAISKGGKVAGAAVKATRAEKAADETLSTYKAAKQAYRKTRSGKVVGKVRDVSRSKKGRAAKAAVYGGAVGGTAVSGDLKPMVEGTLQADPVKALGASAKVALGIPAGVIGVTANSLLTAKRAAVAPFEDNEAKKSVEYIFGPVERLSKESLDSAKEMYDVYTSKDPDRIAKYTEDVAGYFPALSGANMLRAGFSPAARGVGGVGRDAARGGVDKVKRSRAGLPARAEGVDAPAIFPRVANRAENKRTKVRIARESSRRTETEGLGLNDLSSEARKANTGHGRVVNKKLKTLRKQYETEYPGQSLPIAQQDLAMYLGSEARFSTRSVSEALAQIDLREAELDKVGARLDAPERIQLKALREVPELLARPNMAKAELRKLPAKQRSELKGAEKFWNMVDAYRVGAAKTPGVMREQSPREVTDAMAVNTLDPDANLKAPEFELDAQNAAKQADIDGARKAVRKAQQNTVTQQRQLAAQKARVEQMRVAENKRLKVPGRKPSKRLAVAEAKLATMASDLDAHRADVKAGILDYRARQNELDSKLTKQERQVTLAALPADATPSQKKAALGAAREDKLIAKREQDIAPIREEFDSQMEAAMKKYGIERSSFIVHRDELGLERLQSAGSFQRVGTAADKRRTGGMRKKGEVVYDFKAAVDTIQAAAKRESEARLSDALIEDAAMVRDLGNGEQKLFTRAEEADMLRSGQINKGDYKFVRAGMLDSEEGRRKILDSENPAAVLSDMIKEDNRTDVLAQKFDADGQGERGYIMKSSQIDYTLKAMESLEGVFAAMSKVNGYGSRAILHTSFAWMMAQPVAEMLMLTMHHPNPVRMVKAMKVVRDAHSDPTLARALATGADAALDKQTISSNAKAYQGSSHDATKAMKETPVSAIAKSLGTLDAPAYIDRAKGGWIRKVGYVAEVDRELNSKVRGFAKAFSGTLDGVDRVSGKLKHMNRRDQLVWLDTKEGRLAAEQLQSNLDDMLGNWTALGPTERQFAQLIFFYPFVRYSLDWTFRTFPKRHPIRYALLTSMSAWNAQQIEEMFQAKPSFFSDWAQVPIYGSPDGAPTAAVPFSRIAPGGNALVELFGEADSLASLSKGFTPALGIPFRTIFNYDSFGKPKETDPFSNEEPSLFTDVAALPASLLEQGVGMTFPTRYLDREGAFEALGRDKREPQPGDEGPTDLGPFSVPTYPLRSGVFPFVPKDYKQSKIKADVGAAWDRSNEGFEAKSAGGERYTELNEKFGDMADWARPRQGEREDYREYKDLQRERDAGTKAVDKEEKTLRALYKQEGIKVPESLRAEAEVSAWAGESLTKKDRLEVNRIFNGPVGSRASMKRGKGEMERTGWGSFFTEGAATPTPKYKPLKRVQKVNLANRILDVKEKVAGGIKIPGDEGTFVNTLARETGLSPKVVAAWTRQENGNSTGDWNRLNIGHTDSGPMSLTADSVWSNPKTAALETAKFLKGEAYGASESIQAILGNAKGRPDLEQIAAIAGSNWATDPNYQSNIERVYGEVSEPMMKPNPKLQKQFEQLVRRGKAAGIYDAPKNQGYVYPTAKRGELIATPKDHGKRAFGNWMSDNAVDIAVPAGTPVKAMTNAVVTKVSGSAPNHAANPAGWTVYLKDANGEEYSYMHLDDYNVKVGDKVKAGQAFGKSGAANGVEHLHLATLNSNPRKLIQGGQGKQVTKGKLPGPFDGSREMVREIVGSKVRGDKEEGHSATGDHDPSQPNAYAQDINTSGPNPAEGEPAYNQESMDRITKNLVKMGAPADIAGLPIGSNWEGNVGGYDIQLLTAEHGSGPHIHIGARYSGDGSESVPLPGGSAGGSIMSQIKGERYGTSEASTTSATPSASAGSFPSVSSGTAPSGASPSDTPYNEDTMTKWQTLQDFRAEAEAVAPTGSVDLSAAEQIASLPAIKRKKSYV